jgi:hypothetical protein
MTAKRKPVNRDLRQRLTPAAVAAWRRCDYLGLHRALGLHPAVPSPLPATATSLGVDADDEPPEQDARARGWAEAVSLQKELIRLAGFPDCRAAYEENLRQAEERAAYCRELVDDPDKGGRGTGHDPLSRLLALDEAEGEVAWRQQLLDELPN